MQNYETNMMNNLPAHKSDEEYAKEIEQVMRDEELAIDLQALEDDGRKEALRQQAEIARSVVVNGTAPPISGAEDIYSSCIAKTDEEYAKELEQMLCDEELARQLERQEQVQNVEQVNEPPSRRERWKIYICRLGYIFVPLIIGGGLFIYYIILGGPKDMGIPGVFGDEPYLTDNGNITYRWNSGTDGNGLEMKIYNALSEDWYPHFDQAVRDWESGPPKSLSLSTEIIPYDSDCSPIKGYIKACNGNYGYTDWKGINESILINGYIVSSTVRLNDFFMKEASTGSRQYTICHELGHGFGLPHGDENFFNKDLGSCLDYTVRPEKNQRPSDYDFKRLAELYGTIPSGRRSLDRIHPSILSVIDDGIAFRNISLNEKWVSLKRNEYSEDQVMDLGNGYKIHRHIVF